MTSDQNLTPAEGTEPKPAPEPPEPASETPPTTPPAETPAEPVAETKPEEAESPVGASSEEVPNQAVASVEEPVAAPAEEPVAPVAASAEEPEAELSDAALFEAAMSALESGEETAFEGQFKRLTKGERVEATVIQVEKDRVFVDLGTKSEGIVPIAELTEDQIEHASEHVKVGDKIQVIVLKPESGEGNPIVSKKKADFENTWYSIEDAFNEGKVLTAQVVDRVKGGLVVDIGVRGFVPATHVGNGKLRNIDKYVGESLPFKILEIDRERKKVVLSNKLAEEERRAEAKDSLFGNVSVGDVLEGTVRRLTDYGAFVDLGGVDGLLHISEMSWMRINHPKEMFKEGQEIQVMVLRLDPQTGKISLGHRQVLPDPWNLIREAYKVGQKLTVKIGRLVQSGAFVKLPEGAEAFLPLSEMSVRRIKRPQDVLEEGQDVEVQIIDLRPDERRMVLSMRVLMPGGQSGGGYSPMEEDRDFPRMGGGKGLKKKGGKGVRGGRGRDEDDAEEYVGRRGFATGGATIGERLGMLKGFLSK
ncbi:MAG: 30S ribosomal protein S1, partial [Fimbriimonadaceae bacterium]